MVDETLRETLEAAYDEVEQPTSAAPEETGGSEKDTAEPVRDTAPTEESTADDKPAADTSGGRKRGTDGKFLKKEEKLEAQAETATPDQSAAIPEAKPEEPPPEPRTTTRAPESWTPKIREHWAKLHPDVQQEVVRREREITQTLQETSQKRKLAEHFTESIRPFEAMIRSEGRDPVVAAGELFATAALLRMGSPVQKANLVASMVKNFGIPIEMLDAALVGEKIPDEDSKFQRMLDQRLAPVNEFLSEVKGLRQKRQEVSGAEIGSEIEAFANDPTNEFFDYVREDMADLMQIAHQNGRPLTLSKAYERACAANDDIRTVLDKRRSEAAAKKRDAGSSLPSGAPPQGAAKGGSGSLRDDVEAAFASVANR